MDSVGDTVTEMAGEGIDLVQSSVDYTLGANVENLTLTGTAGLKVNGNALNNEITGTEGADSLDGGSGDDVLFGGVGADSMSGGAGTDIYFVDNVADEVTKDADGGGADVVASFVNYELGDNLEYLVLLGDADLTGTGNELDNVLFGNDGNNTLSGDSSNDEFGVSAGSDSIAGGRGQNAYVITLPRIRSLDSRHLVTSR